MDIKAFPALIVGVVVALVLAGAVLPVFAETTSATDTFKNVGYYDMTYSETDNLIFKWDHTKPNQVMVNDVVVALPQADATPKTILCGDNWIIRYAYSSTNGTFVQFYGSSGSNVSASEGEIIDLSVECSNGSVSVANTADTPATFSTTYTHLYVVTDSGDLVMKKADDLAYLNGDSQIVAMGLSRIGTVSNVGVMVTGSITDGFTWSMFRGSDTTFSNQSATYNTVSSYLDLYKLEKVTASATNSTGTSDLTYNYFMVPAEVTAEKAVHPDGPLTVILNVLPLLAIAGLVTGAVVWFINRKG